MATSRSSASLQQILLLLLLLGVGATLVPLVSAFQPSMTTKISYSYCSTSTASCQSSSTTTVVALHAGKGFGNFVDPGNNNNNNNKKTKEFGDNQQTYDNEQNNIIKDVIDTEGAMSEFFRSNEEWHPLFLELLAAGSSTSSSSPGLDFMNHKSTTITTTTSTSDTTTTSSGSRSSTWEYYQTDLPPSTSAAESSSSSSSSSGVPWKRLNGIPTAETDRQVLATVLDTMQAGLLDIPVDESTKEDANDLHFLEEGRRLLAIDRFHVLQNVCGGSIDCHDVLFSTCWSELMELRVKNKLSTGSLIVVPDYDIADLKRFTDINLLRPLEWLGVQADFEVTSLKFGCPAIRLLYKLQDMPEQPWNGPPDETELNL